MTKFQKSGSQNLQKEVIFRPIAQVTTYKTKKKKKERRKRGGEKNEQEENEEEK